MQINLRNLIYFALLSLMISNLAKAQELVSVDYQVSGKQVFIYYNFQADTNKDYNVTVKLRRSTTPNFIYAPINVYGDIGEGKFAGKKRTIIWNLTEHELKTLTYKDFYFEVIAEVSNGWPWYYYASGVGIIAAGVTWLLLPKQDVPVTQVGFPMPPGTP